MSLVSDKSTAQSANRTLARVATTSDVALAAIDSFHKNGYFIVDGFSGVDVGQRMLADVIEIVREPSRQTVRLHGWQQLLTWLWPKNGYFIVDGFSGVDVGRECSPMSSLRSCRHLLECSSFQRPRKT